MPDESIESLKAKLLLYEQNGAAKLYYAMNRKLNEMADVLNGIIVKNIPLEDIKDKTFDRVMAIIKNSADTSAAIKQLGETAGVTGDEKSDVERKPFIEMIATKRE